MPAYEIAQCTAGDVETMLRFERQMARELGFPEDDPRATYDANWFRNCCLGSFARDNGHKLESRAFLVRVQLSQEEAGGILTHVDRQNVKAPHSGGHKRARRVSERFAELFWIYVAPKHRKAALGTMLVEHALADAAATWPEIKRARLHCIHGNSGGYAFWKRMGFTTLRTVKDYPVEGIHAYRMERILEGQPHLCLPKRDTPPAATTSHLTRVPDVIVVCGPTGAGKTTVGKELASITRGSFVDADDHHTDENRAKMATGQPLTDEDRAPWLAKLHALIAQACKAQPPTGERHVFACSALKKAYRRTLRGNMGAKVGFVMLEPTSSILVQRVSSRQRHFMPASLVQSQLDILEPLAEEDQPCISVRFSAAKWPAPRELAERIASCNAREWGLPSSPS